MFFLRAPLSFLFVFVFHLGHLFSPSLNLTLPLLATDKHAARKKKKKTERKKKKTPREKERKISFHFFLNFIVLSFLSSPQERRLIPFQQIKETTDKHAVSPIRKKRGFSQKEKKKRKNF